MGMDNSSLALEWRFYYLIAVLGYLECECEADMDENDICLSLYM
jgi:hypothetical protein